MMGFRRLDEVWKGIEFMKIWIFILRYDKVDGNLGKEGKNI